MCSGDIFGGQNAIDGLLKDFVAANVSTPWLLVEGNHDGESGLNYTQVSDYILTLPNGLNEPNPVQVNDSTMHIYGNTNFFLQVLGPKGSADENASLFNIYAIDSNSYSTDPSIGGYGWVHADQIAWFTAVSANLTAAAKAQGRPQAPALAYQHIPLPQHQTIITDKLPIVGQYHETVCCPVIDTGLHAAFQAMGDVKALTVGHDHTNDFCGVYEGITYCYDGHGSYGASGYGEPDWPIRARVWHVSAMGATIDTYKALDTLAGGIPVPNRVIDLQTVWSRAPVAALALSLTEGSPACPPGFAADHHDLNFGAGGAYAHLCVARATADASAPGAGGALVADVTAVVAAAGPGAACPAGYTAAGGNVKAGTVAALEVRVCYRPAGDGDKRVATAVSVAQGRRGSAPRCPAGLEAASGDLSAGVGERSVLCARYEARSAEVLARGRHPAGRRLPRHGEWAFSTRLAANKSDVAALGAAAPVRVSVGAVDAATVAAPRPGLGGHPQAPPAPAE